MSLLLTEVLKNRGIANRARGIYSVCSAHPWVIRASVQQAIQDGSPLLVEATSNQVNQMGGYTGMQPQDFKAMVLGIASEEGLPVERVILGGDHLGPNPWQNKPAAEAMELAKAMIAGYAAAGFTKLHLDASMACAGERLPLSEQIVAERAAELCHASEAACTGERPRYIIGTEVPIPGGAQEAMGEVAVTTREAAEKTLSIHREVFYAHGLEQAWSRVVGLVVQPGVEFNHDSVLDYAPEKARELVSLLKDHPGLTFEAHSTDYQTPGSYRALVDDGFAILKVGPALTFALREALFALAAMEDELIVDGARSNLKQVMEDAMVREPKHWQQHYHGRDLEETRLLRRYSYSDRMRYYWAVPEVQRAVEVLMANLSAIAIPETLLSAFLPVQYAAVRSGALVGRPMELVLDAVRQALLPYAAACLAR